ncbi:MAG TPA: rhamnogalacturonan lyase [Polyangiaceae bacterium]|nr:rhamnogalacturonan lyase [Polyangiaceae bacterium]
MKKMQPQSAWRSSAVLMFALTLAHCGSDGGTGSGSENEGPGAFDPNNPSAGEPPAGDPAMPDDEAAAPGVSTPPNGEGNPDDVTLGESDTPEQPGSPGDPAAQPGDPVGPTPTPDGPLGTGFAGVENLDRGVVAVVQQGGVYVGWRMFGYEYDRDNPARIAYNLYRDGNRIATVTDSTNFRDTGGAAGSAYAVALVADGVEGPRSAPVTPWAQNFLRVPLESPGANYNAHDSSLGDLDGDGQYEIVLLWQPNDARDNSQAGVTSNVFIDGLKLDGTRLWRIDLGPNMRAGEHYNQFIVIDADGDGRAELGLKTAPGTRDSSGQFLSKGPAQNDDDAQVFRNADGYVLAGPEYFTVFDGLSGRELATAAYHTPRGTVASWGDNYGNRLDRYLAAAAYVDDTGLPSFVMARGYYTRTTLGAYNWRDGQLTQLWKFDSNVTPRDGRGNPFTGQGAHSLSVANVDADPEQEIIYGEMTVDNDGTGKCSVGTGHGDALHVGDFIPSRPGVEAFMPAEDTSQPYYTLRDPNDCTVLQQSNQTGADVGRAVADDIFAGNPGAEFWASNGVTLRSATTGQVLAGVQQPNSVNFLIWWDADETRELENGTTISKLGAGNLLNCQQCASNNGTKSVPNLVADLIGDWREEVIWREANNTGLRIYTTTDVTERRIYTLMHDPQYRSAISWQNVAYNQPPHPSFQIGNGMSAPPTPDIHAIPRLAPIPEVQ